MSGVGQLFFFGGREASLGGRQTLDGHFGEPTDRKRPGMTVVVVEISGSVLRVALGSTESLPQDKQSRGLTQPTLGTWQDQPTGPIAAFGTGLEANAIVAQGDGQMIPIRRGRQGTPMFEQLTVNQLNSVVAGLVFEDRDLAPVPRVPIQKQGTDPTDAAAGLQPARSADQIHPNRALDVCVGVKRRCDVQCAFDDVDTVGAGRIDGPGRAQWGLGEHFAMGECERRRHCHDLQGRKAENQQDSFHERCG